MSDAHIIGKHAAIRKLWREYRSCIRKAARDARNGYPAHSTLAWDFAEQARLMAEKLESELPQ